MEVKIIIVINTYIMMIFTFLWITTWLWIRIDSEKSASAAIPTNLLDKWIASDNDVSKFIRKKRRRRESKERKVIGRNLRQSFFAGPLFRNTSLFLAKRNEQITWKQRRCVACSLLIAHIFRLHVWCNNRFCNVRRFLFNYSSIYVNFRLTYL